MCAVRVKAQVIHVMEVNRLNADDVKRTQIFHRVPFITQDVCYV